MKSVSKSNVLKAALAVLLLFAIAVMPVMAGGGRQSGSGKITVRYICLQKGNPYFDPIIAGMKEAVESQGGVFRDTAPEQSEATAQIPLIEAAIQDKVNVICVSPTAADTMNTVLDKARAAGIKILMVNDDITGNESHRDGSVLSCNYDQLAIDSFEQFAKAMNYQGKFVVLSATTDSPFQNNQIAIYKKQLASDPKYKDLQLLEVLYGNDDSAKSLTETEAAIQKYPDLKGIITPTTVGATAAGQVIESRGLARKIIVTGLNTPQQSKAFLKSGALAGVMLWDTFRTGKVAGYLAMLLAKGEYTLKPGTSFDAGEYGATPVLTNNVLYGGPPALITAENVDTYKF
ncbi:MAG: substrate-binding domain-containing protein [Treponema sp.]|jgi:rhamnose transport system substrate-binding protein|nr:substrate-binding domain-containing protein [Treponema sp.]